ncbi:unnamed protein product [Echinostoma caproni]|uniref:C2H2-type domain-containing protein n=1 Tax=Echinostoma caproni TaxID=27848 RepID=A0A182ZZV6_9TREM|nr:unnamed protein product [Echinostoma caproni]
MAEAIEAKQCFNCQAKFYSDDAFWDHVYNVNCGSDTNVVGSTSTKSKSDEPNKVNGGISEQGDGVKSSTTTDPSTHFECALCCIQFPSSGEWYAHSKSDEHRNKVAAAAGHYASATSTKKDKPATEFKTDASEAPSRAFCDECQVPLPSHEARAIHVMGKKHQKAMNRILKDNLFSGQTALGFSDASTSSSCSMQGMDDILTPTVVLNKPVSVPLQSEPPLNCEFCRVSLSDLQEAQQHVSGQQHQTNVNTVSSLKIKQSSNISPLLMAHLKISAPTQLDELIGLLRRLCLAQLTSLMYQLEQSISAGKKKPVDAASVNLLGEENFSGVSTHDLLELFRSVCKEELELMLSSRVPARY